MGAIYKPVGLTPDNELLKGRDGSEGPRACPRVLVIIGTVIMLVRRCAVEGESLQQVRRARVRESADDVPHVRHVRGVVEEGDETLAGGHSAYRVDDPALVCRSRERLDFRLQELELAELP